MLEDLWVQIIFRLLKSHKNKIRDSCGAGRTLFVAEVFLSLDHIWQEEKVLILLIIFRTACFRLKEEAHVEVILPSIEMCMFYWGNGGRWKGRHQGNNTLAFCIFLLLILTFLYFSKPLQLVTVPVTGFCLA